MPARRRHAVVATLAAVVLLLVSQAWGARIGIDAGGDPNSRLEIRSVTLPDGTEVQLYVLQGEGLRVRVEPAHGAKCSRCWVYSEGVGENERYPDLCERCAGVLE